MLRTTLRRLLATASVATTALVIGATSAAAVPDNLTVGTGPTTADQLGGSFYGNSATSVVNNGDLDAFLATALGNVGLEPTRVGDFGDVAIDAPVTCACTVFGLWVSGANVFVNANTNLGSGEFQVNGPATVGAAVTTGDQRWLGPVTFASSGMTTSTSTTSFSSTVGGSATANIGSSTRTTFAGNVALTGSAALDVTGAATIKDIDVTAPGGQTWHDDVLLTDASGSSTDPSSIAFSSGFTTTFQNGLDGASDIDVTGAASFGNVGATTPLRSIAAHGAVSITGLQVTTTDAQTYDGQLTAQTGTTTITAGGTGLSANGITNIYADTLVVSGPATFSGPVRRTGGLSKIGAGDLVLSGVSDYTGPTSVGGSGRTILTGSITSNATVTTGTLRGTGTSTGSVAVTSTGTLDPGSTASPSTGTLTTGPVAMTTGSVFHARVDGTTAPKVSTSGVTLDGATLQVTTTTPPVIDNVLLVVDNTGLGAVVGTFAGLGEGDTYVQGANAYRVSYVGGTGNDVTLTRVKVPTTTTVAASTPSPTLVGAPATFTATVSPAAATGTVTFLVDGTPIGTVAVSGGTASASTSQLAVGEHVVVASYSGDSGYGASMTPTSPALVHRVAQLSTTLDLRASASTGRVGDSLVLTATAASSRTPQGMVTFTDNGDLLGVATLDATGVASFSTTTLKPGVHVLAASLGSGDTFGASSSGTVTYSVLAVTSTKVTGACMGPTTKPAKLAFTTSTAARTTVTVTRLISTKPPKCGTSNKVTGALKVPAGRYVAIGSKTFPTSAGKTSTTLAKVIKPSKLAPGTYQFELVARSADGVATKVVRLGFVITG